MPSRRLVGSIAVLAFAVLLLPRPLLASELSERRAAMGLADYRAGRFEEALSRFEEAVDADAEDANAWYWLGAALAGLGRWAEAATAFERAAAIDAAMTDALLAAGLAHLELGEDEAALPPLRRAAADEETGERASALLAHALRRLGREEEARAVVAGSAVAGATVTQVVPAPPDAKAPAPSRWAVDAGLKLEYDSNPEVVPSIGLDRASQLFDDGEVFREDGDFRSVMEFGAVYAAVRGEHVDVDVSYAGSQSLHFERAANDLGNHRLAADGAVRHGSAEYGLSAAYDYYLRDHGSLLHQGTLRPWVALDSAAGGEERWGRAEVYYEARLRDYVAEDFERLDGANHAVGLDWTIAAGDVAVLSAGYHYEREDVGSGARRPFAFHGHEVAVGGEAALGDATLLQAGYHYRNEDYDNRIRLRPDGSGRARSDAEHGCALSLRRRLAGGFWLLLAFEGTWNDSSVPLFDYERYVTTLGLEWYR